MKYENPSFSIAPGRTSKYRENWSRVFEPTLSPREDNGPIPIVEDTDADAWNPIKLRADLAEARRKLQTARRDAYLSAADVADAAGIRWGFLRSTHYSEAAKKIAALLREECAEGVA